MCKFAHRPPCNTGGRVNWDDLRVFLAVARSGSISSGAKLLDLQHSTVSRRIRKLEQDLGVRLLDSFPGLVLALAFVAALGPSLDNAIIAIALTGWPGLARLARAETLVFRSHDYISVVRLQGGSHARVIFLNLMPLCLPSVIVRITLSMSSILLTAAGLGFLGLGAQPPTPEWGAMLSTGRRFMLDHWWLVTMPGCTILIVSLAFNLLGDGLRDILDPRSEHK